MAVRIACVMVLVAASVAAALDSLDSAGLRVAFRVFEECSRSDGLSPCLKRKALTVLDRLGRMDKLALTEEIAIVRAPDAPAGAAAMTEEQLDQTLPRELEARDQALTTLLWDKVTSLVRSRNIELTLPRLSDIDFEEGRKGDLDFGGDGGGHGGGFGGGGGKGKGKSKGGKKGGGLFMGMMMGMMGKMMGMIPMGIAGLFLLAGKALITSKIALMLSGIIALKKLLAAKNGGGGGGGGYGGGHGGGYGGGFGGGHGGGGGGHAVWTSSGGGWDKRSFDDSHKLAYSAYTTH